ncbi:hypothetical protein KDA_62680 [Dictyobacter alpinus]|uniref:3-keto-5-aminohexanoate cleavage enzyme n=1 Tax=Dictyobacter alpinus TaxID=2014873 RepID=A0A402BH90_9CHLR|nr:3-keto-5-aminohexanoate cleavage protein [Dictyobacter alpinus]GCE30784.1 hypothetical protein KDA_62680 [Dictyobacter alpinus]
MLIQACLNGSREPGAHPALPLTPEELARDAETVVAKGAQALHIHPRQADGKQSLLPQDIAAALTAVRARCPGIAVGVSTGIWIEPDLSLRLRNIQDWRVLPDFASVNFSEQGVADLCQALRNLGVGIEAGISSAAEVELLQKLGLREQCLRILIEPAETETEAAMNTIAEIIYALNQTNLQLPRLLHGTESTTWPILDVALTYGYDIRIGLEDTLTLPDGGQTQGNAELVSLAMKQATIIKEG